MSFQAIPSQGLARVTQVLVDLNQNIRNGTALVLLQPISRSSFIISVNQLVVLLLFNFVIATLFGYIRMGSAATFNYSQITILALHVLLLLFAGVLVSRLHGEDDWALSIPLIVASTYLPYEMVYSTYDLLSRNEIVQLETTIETMLPYLGMAWTGSVLLFFFSRILGLGMPRLVLSLALFSLTVFAPRYYFPVAELWWSNAEEIDVLTGNKSDSVTQENIFYAQADMLPNELSLLQPGQPNRTDLYFIGMAPYASQDVFFKEVGAVHDIFKSRFHTEGRSLTLVNHRTALQTAPIASLTSLRKALQHIGSLMNVEEDILFLYITTHGSRTHELSVDLYPLKLSTITPLALKAALAESNIKWKVIVISACYAGGFVEPLKDESTVVITAADATHTSFGCGNQFDFTYFGQAFFDQELRQTYSFMEAFDKARLAIAKREATESLTPSNPQIFISDAMKTKLQQYENELSARAKKTATLAAAP